MTATTTQTVVTKPATNIREFEIKARWDGQTLALTVPDELKHLVSDKLGDDPDIGLWVGREGDRGIEGHNFIAKPFSQYTDDNS